MDDAFAHNGTVLICGLLIGEDFVVKKKKLCWEFFFKYSIFILCFILHHASGSIIAYFLL